MRIHNVRLGLACNSSSSHSLVFLPPARTADMKDYQVGLHAPEEWPIKGTDSDGNLVTRMTIPAGDWDFGWGYFTAVSEAAKRQYLALTLLHNLRTTCTPEIAHLVAQEWAGTRLHGGNPYGSDGYIDHESQIILPRAWDNRGLDPEFTRRWVDYMMQEGIVICGGNDNDDDVHELVEDSESTNAELGLPRDGGNSGFVCRYDEKFEYWTLFNRNSGNKMRVSFDQPSSFKVDRASTPELVDIKITDFCPYDCPFCYMGSTNSGKHLKDYYQWVWLLQEMKVFEVAIGGGEPTLHPKFVEILESFRRAGIVPNFTTKNLSWLRDPKKWKPILELCGSFAVSVTSKEEVKELGTLLDLIGADEHGTWFSRSNVSVQYVMGSTRQYDLRGIAKAAFKAKIKLTLLGYKRTGRGKEWEPEKYDGWINEIKEAADGHYAQVNIDTALAKEYEDQLKDEGIPSWLFHTTEGSFSMYIDAVESRLGPSSYCTEEEMVAFEPGYPRDEKAEELRKAFQSFHGWEAPLPRSRMELLQET